MRTANAIEAIVDFSGDADILVNNAGDIPHGTLQAVDAAQWRKSWDLKVYGYIDLSRALYEPMRVRGAGVIVNVIGMAGGEMNVPGYIAGTAGNAALHAFTRALGTLSPNDGIRVVGIHPGAIATDHGPAVRASGGARGSGQRGGLHGVVGGVVYLGHYPHRRRRFQSTTLTASSHECTRHARPAV
jgi:NAD(P)-dependent dehydrogenase (short-subunit alcohol dehydrogenase family)